MRGQPQLSRPRITGALAVVAVTIGVVFLGGLNQRPAQALVTLDGTVDFVGVDMNTSGNSGTGLGPFDRCGAVTGTFDVDVVVNRVPLVTEVGPLPAQDDRVAAFSARVVYDNAKLSINSADLTNSIINSSGSTLIPGGDLTDDGDISYGALDTTVPEHDVAGIGMRLNFTVVGSGSSEITVIGDADITSVLQVDNDQFDVTNLAPYSSTSPFGQEQSLAAIAPNSCLDLAVDTNVSGNTASTLGSLDTCVEVANSATFDVDVTIDAIPDVADPTVDGVSTIQYVVRYGSSLLTLNSADRGFLLANDPDSDLLPGATSAPTELAAGPPRVIGFGNFDTSGGAGAEENIRGVGARLNFTAHPSATGAAEVSVLPTYGANDTLLLQVDNDVIPITHIQNGFVVVGVSGGCSDNDSDGIPSAADLCAGTTAGPVDGAGCSDAQVDTDSDGVCNSGAPSGGPSGCTGSDLCPGTAPGATVDANGCSASQVDEDGDGICNSGAPASGCTGTDLCPGTPDGQAVDGNGCSDLQVDEDLDGVCDPGAPSAGPSGCSGTDNCSGVPNGPTEAGVLGVGNQTNTDAQNETDGFLLSGSPLSGDGDGDACDPDDDNDGWSDAGERIIFGVAAGSPEERTPCRTDTVDDPWPPDIYGSGGLPDRIVNFQDLNAIVPHLFLFPPGPPYDVRSDLFQPGIVINFQDLNVFLPVLFKSCQPPP